MMVKNTHSIEEYVSIPLHTGVRLVGPNDGILWTVQSAFFSV
jgi:hypothetical protein